jgi:nucleotide-binding universal stress UspA family protein
MLRRILVPLDGSCASERALPYAVELAKKFDAEMLLLRVVRPSFPVSPVGPSGIGIVSPHTNELLVRSAKEEESSALTGADIYLRNQTHQLVRLGIACIYKVMLGDPAESIIEFCSKESTDLVVMATSGKGGLKRAILGSVADKVTRTSGFPVLLVRGDIGKRDRRASMAYSLEHRVN